MEEVMDQAYFGLLVFFGIVIIAIAGFLYYVFGNWDRRK